MYKILLYCLFLIILCTTQGIRAQDSYTTPSRTPEQEAAFLTEKMKKDLYLTTQQSQAIYEINLRYARERKVETTRIKALERVRLKDEEIRQVLTVDQISRMQEKRINRSPSVNPSDSREYTTQPQYKQTQPGNSAQPYDRNIQSPTYYRSDRQSTITNYRSSATENTARSQPSATSGSQPRASSTSSSGSQTRSAVPSSSGSQTRSAAPSSSGSQTRSVAPSNQSQQQTASPSSSGNRSSSGTERTSNPGNGSTRR